MGEPHKDRQAQPFQEGAPWFKMEETPESPAATKQGKAKKKDTKEMKPSPKANKKEAEKEAVVKAPKYTWADLETIKARTASALDRVEYLASTRNLFTDFQANEANRLGKTILTRSAANTLAGEQMKASEGLARKVLERHSSAVIKDNTVQKRLDAITRFVFKEEGTRQGKQGLEAAKKSAKGSKPNEPSYPLYADLKDLKAESERTPVMSVTCLMPYLLPESALPKIKGEAKPKEEEDPKAKTM